MATIVKLICAVDFFLSFGTHFWTTLNGTQVLQHRLAEHLISTARKLILLLKQRRNIFRNRVHLFRMIRYRQWSGALREYQAKCVTFPAPLSLSNLYQSQWLTPDELFNRFLQFSLFLICTPPRLQHTTTFRLGARYRNERVTWVCKNAFAWRLHTLAQKL